MALFPKGSEWRKWDLHIHTPCSIQQKYGGDTPEVWEKFITSLESLPEEVKVIGINDYYWLDGFLKVMEYRKKEGRLKNIEKVFPLIEFRIDTFASANDAKISKVNLHVLFNIDDNKYKEQIESINNEFLNQIRISNAEDHSTKNLSIKKNFIDYSPNKKLKDGLAQLVPPLEDIKKVLNTPTWKEKTFVFIGYNEWNNLDKGQQLKINKREIFNLADAFFTGNKEEDNTKKIDILKEYGNTPLIHSLDIHSFDDNDKGSLDNNYQCFTWIKADPTFEGLKQILIEPEDRVFIGNVPEQIKNFKENKQQFIENILIKKKLNTQVIGNWFDCDIPFNCGLTTIIGNKGNGKSALSDIIGLLGNTKNYEHFSFLTKYKFRDPKNKLAEKFYAEIKWANGTLNKKDDLKDDPIDNSLERIIYIPQYFLETVCSDKNDKFESELKRVIFSYLDIEKKHFKETFDQLIDFKTHEIEKEINLHRSNLSSVLKEITLLDKESTFQFKSTLKNELTIKKEELAQHNLNKPAKIDTPDNEDTNQKIKIKTIDKLKEKLSKFDLYKKNITILILKNETELELLKQMSQKLKNADDFLKDIYQTISEIISKTQIKYTADDILSYKINDDYINEHKNNINFILQFNTQVKNYLQFLIDKIDNKIKQIIEKIDKGQQKYQEYLKNISTWKNKKFDIIQSIRGILKRLRDFEQAPETRKKLVEKRTKIVKKIHESFLQLKSEYEDLYKPIQKFIDDNKILNQNFDLKFQVFIVSEKFSEQFLEMIDKNKSKNFSGKEQSKDTFNKIVEKYNLENFNDLIDCLSEIENKLLYDDEQKILDVQKQLKEAHKVEHIYEFIWELKYIEPKYSLTFLGADIQKLSPGQRGTLLLIFYLLIDNNRSPIVIDQPEENLDNHTVFHLLVPIIKEAKKKRQVIMVTHNPNIAVVCDAEQIIYSEIDRKNNNKVIYSSGSIENKHINKKLLEVLEGTKPAFENREKKYGLQ